MFSWFRRHWVAVVTVPAIVLLVGTLAVVVTKWAPHWLASTTGLEPNEAAEERGRVRTALLATLAGVLAATGAYYTHRTFALNRAGQITERFTRATDQLGNPQIDVRLGGIYALERIARDSRDAHPQVVEVLTAYVRQHARWRLEPPEEATSGQAVSGISGQRMAAIRALERIAGGAEPESETGKAGGDQPPSDAQVERLEPPIDVEAAMRVLGRRRSAQDGPRRLHLVGTDLRGIALLADEANLARANLASANLEGAALENLQDAILIQAKLQDAYLHEGNLKSASLNLADLEDANLTLADLSDARLDRANLTGANLAGANLAGANLAGAGLYGASLRDADLTRASLYGAVLHGANLNGAQLRGATYDAGTTWPKGFDPEAAGAVMS